MFTKLAASSGLVFPDGIVSALDAALSAGVNAFLLEGEPGTGKTHLGRAFGNVASATNGGFIFSQANAWTSDEAVIRGVDLAGFVERDASRVYAAGVLLKAARLASERAGTVVVLLDEWDKTRPVADGLLLAAMQERIVADSAGTVHASLPANVVFWITSNATRPLADALVRRTLRIVLPRMEAASAVALMKRQVGCGDHLASALVALRDRVQTPVTLPDMLRLAAVLQHAQDVATCRVLATGLLRNDLAGRKFDPGADLWSALGRDRSAL